MNTKNKLIGTINHFILIVHIFINNIQTNFTIVCLMGQP